MKFKIHKETVVTKTNIFGKPVGTETRYYIYRPVFFGLFKIYVRFLEDWVGEFPSCVNYWKVSYHPKSFSTRFYKEEDAKRMLDLIYSQPDKFIRQ